MTGKLATVPVDTFAMTTSGISPAEGYSAALWLAGKARDTGDLRDLLEMLGLLPYDSPRRPPVGTAGAAYTSYERP